MAANLSMSDVQSSLRVLYDDSTADQTLKIHKLLAWMDRDEDFNEYNFRLPVKVANPTGTATSYTTAAANATAAVPYAFNLVKTELHNYPQINNELIEGAKRSPDKFFKSITNIIDGAKEDVLSHMGRGVYRATAGVFSQVRSATSSPITVTYPQDLYSIEAGMIITASQNADMSSPRSGTGVVTYVDRDAGTLTYTGTITSLAVGDYLAVSGITATASGLLGWSPTSAPGSTAFFGLDRTASSYLAGRRVDCSLMGPEEVWTRVNAEMLGMSEKPVAFFCNPQDAASFEVGMAGQKQVTGRKYEFGFDALSVYGNDLISDPDCPRGYAFGVPETWKIYSLGPAPKTLDTDGNVLRVGAGDFCQARIISRWQCGTTTPNAIMTITLPV